MFDRSINKVILVGNLGKDPELRYTQNGITVASLALATTESWKDKTTGERQENTEWHRLSVFNRLGEMCGQYLKKGNKIYVEGRLKTRKWQAQDGSDRYTTEIIVSNIEMLDSNRVTFSNNSVDSNLSVTSSVSKINNQAVNAPGPSYGVPPIKLPVTPSSKGMPIYKEPSSNSVPSPENNGYAELDFDDDIPF